MNDDCLKLTVYYGERDRAGGGFLADALVDVFARHELQTSLVMRGSAGFGAKQHLRTDRLLTLSEDLPLVSVAVDTRERIQAALADLDALRIDGLVTLERARMLPGRLTAVDLPGDLHEPTKLTIYVGRQQRVGSRPAYEAVVDLLHRHGVAGATVLLGVDGTAHGARRRARFFASNADVPLMVISVGNDQQIAGPPRARRDVAPAVATLERVVSASATARRSCPRPAGRRRAARCSQRQALRPSTSASPRRTTRGLVDALRAVGRRGRGRRRGHLGRSHGDHAPPRRRVAGRCAAACWSTRRVRPAERCTLAAARRAMHRATGLVTRGMGRGLAGRPGRGADRPAGC